MHTETTTLRGLTCRTIDWLPEGREPRLLVVLCHGFGAPGDDLVPLAPALVRLAPELAATVRFVFTEAPLSLDALGMYGGRAWWYIDIARLMNAIERREFRELRDEVPEGLAAARDALTGVVDDLRQQTGLPASALVLGGFSQGAMLATDVTLRLAERPAGLCAFSGSLICEADWRQLALQRGSLPVVQSHGRHDPILPYEGAEALRDLLVEAGLPVEFVGFPGMHEIPAAAVERFADMLRRVSDESSPGS